MRESELRGRLHSLHELAYWQQVAPLEQLVREADALGIELLQAEIRTALLTALTFGDRPESELAAPFSWLVRRFDDRPSWWGPTHDYDLLWSYKWMVNAALRDHRVPLSVVDGLIDGMEQRYLARGQQLTAVLGCRFARDRQVLGVVAARAAYDAWVAAPRTDLCDCQACVPDVRAGYLVDSGLDEEALDEATPVLDGHWTCEEQPQLIAATTVPAMLRLGHEAAATHWHLWGSRTSRANPAETGMLARHIETAALAGHPGRAVDLLEERLPALLQPTSPEEALALSAAGAVALGRLETSGAVGREVRGPEGVTCTVAELRARLEATASDIAAAFDLRNGTGTQAERLRQRLAAPDLPTLVLGVVAAPAVELTTETRADTDTDGDRPLDLPLLELWALDRESVRRGDDTTLQRIATSWLNGHATDAAWDLLDPLAGDPEAALAVVDLSRDALRHHEHDANAPATFAARASRFARAAGGVLQQTELDQVIDLLEARRLIASGASDDEVDTLRRRVHHAVGVVDTELASGAHPLRSDTLVAATVRGRAAWLTADPDLHASLVRESLAITADVGPGSPFEQRWTRAATLVTASTSAPYGDADACQEVLRILGPDELPHLRADAQLQLALVALTAHDGDLAMTHVEEATAIVEEAPHESILRTTAMRVDEWIAGADVDHDRALGVMQRLLARLQSLTDRLPAAALGHAMSRVLLDSGRTLEAAEVAEHWLEVTRRHRDEEGAVNAAALEAGLAGQAGEASLQLGETNRAIAAGATAQRLWAEQERWLSASAAANLQGRAHEEAHDHVDASRGYGEAADLADCLLGLGTWAGLPDGAVNRRARAGMLLRSDGLPAALAAYAAAEAFVARHSAEVLGADTDDPRLEDIDRGRLITVLGIEAGMVRMRRATTLLEAGEARDALGELDRLEGEFAIHYAWREAVWVLSLRAQCLVALGKGRKALACWKQGTAEADRHGLLSLRHDLAADWAAWLDGEGRSKEAEQVWSRWGRD